MTQPGPDHLKQASQHGRRGVGGVGGGGGRNVGGGVGDGDALIELQGVSRSFGSGESAVMALRSVDLVVRAGEFCAVVGPSGSGKSTLLNMIGLLDSPTGGSLTLDGVDVVRMRERERTRLRSQVIGFVFQAFHLIAYKTVLDNVALSTSYAGIARRMRRELADQALRTVGLAHRRDAYPTTLSGGEQQRAAIARALASRPKLLLCDEPTGNLDSANAAAIIDVLRGLNLAQHLTVVVITHDHTVAAQADRVIAMNDGRIVSDAPAAEAVLLR